MPKTTRYHGSGTFVWTAPDEAETEYEIEFEVSGYHTPAQLYGPPENCYPEEGEMEVDITGSEPDLPKEYKDRAYDALVEYVENNLDKWEEEEENGF